MQLNNNKKRGRKNESKYELDIQRENSNHLGHGVDLSKSLTSWLHASWWDDKFSMSSTQKRENKSRCV